MYNVHYVVYTLGCLSKKKYDFCRLLEWQPIAEGKEAVYDNKNNVLLLFSFAK